MSIIKHHKPTACINFIHSSPGFVASNWGRKCQLIYVHLLGSCKSLVGNLPANVLHSWCSRFFSVYLVTLVWLVFDMNEDATAVKN